MFNILVALDRVFSAHVLACHLDPHKKVDQKMYELFTKLRLRLTKASQGIELFLAENEDKKSQHHWFEQYFNRTRFKSLFTLGRVIDGYLCSQSAIR